MEKLRQALVAWNVAPLLVVGFLCACTWKLVDFVIVQGDSIDPIMMTGVLGLIGSTTVLLKDCFNTMKKSAE